LGIYIKLFPGLLRRPNWIWEETNLGRGYPGLAHQEMGWVNWGGAIIPLGISQEGNPIIKVKTGVQRVGHKNI